MNAYGTHKSVWRIDSSVFLKYFSKTAVMVLEKFVPGTFADAKAEFREARQEQNFSRISLALQGGCFIATSL